VDGALVLLLLFGMVFFVPWIVRQLFTSANRHVISRAVNERADELIQRTVAFTIDEVAPVDVIRAVAGDAGFPSEKAITTQVYISEVTNHHVTFELDRKFNVMEPGWRSRLEVKPTEVGCRGDYAIVAAYEFDGRAEGVKEMEATERTLRSFLARRFPDIRFSVL
jgi:hypothetical protein